MRVEDYPEQEPFTRIGALYHEEVLGRAGHLAGHDLFYGDDPYQSLAVFPAEDSRGNVLCFMHGGGWTNGYKEWMSFMAPAVNRIGATFVSIGYRLAPAHVFPAGFDDCCDAIAMVCQKVAAFGGDPGRIFIGGHSAGGHYAALMGLRTDWQASRDVSVDVIRGVLPVSGTFEFGEGSGLSMRPRFLGPEDSGNEAPASPVNHVRSGAPPFLVAWGDNDFPHLVRQASTFVDALRANRVDATQLILEDCDHLGASYACGDDDGSWIRAAAGFMEKPPRSGQEYTAPEPSAQ